MLFKYKEIRLIKVFKPIGNITITYETKNADMPKETIKEIQDKLNNGIYLIQRIDGVL